MATIATTIPTATLPEAPALAGLGGDVVSVPVPGGTISVEILGHGPPLMLLHGWTLDRRIWIPQLPLAQHRQLIAIDRRGFGQSSAPPDLAREPADVLAVADALGLDRFAILAMSQAGRVALSVALQAPNRVSHVALLGSALDGVADPSDTHSLSVPFAAMRAAAQSGDLEQLRSAWRTHPFMAARSIAGRRIVRAIVDDYQARDLLEAGGSLPMRPAELADLPMPVLAVAGADDTQHRRAIAAAIARPAPFGQHAIIPDAGHLTNLDAAETVNSMLLQFLSG